MTEERRTAVVTGSTSGIGHAIAARLARENYNVVLNYAADDARAMSVLDDFRRRSPRVIAVKADISDPTAATALISRAVDTYGTLDILVNNAARVVDRPALEMTVEDWDKVLNTNLKGAFLCSQHAARHMLHQTAGGLIVNIGASTGIRGRLNGANTCASKAGLMILTQCLALEWGPKIRVNTVVPGLTLTDETAHRFRLSDPAVLRDRAASVPLQRIGQPSDIADAVMLLLAPEANFITGQKIVVDGGQYMW